MTFIPENITPEHIDNIILRNKSGAAIARIGLLATVYVQEPNTQMTRERIIAALDYMMTRFQEHYQWVNDNKPASVRVKENLLFSYRTSLPERTLPSLFSFKAYSADKKDDPTSYSVRTYLPLGTPSPRLAYFSLSVPVAWAAQHKPGALQNLFSELCNILQPLHGYAGLGVIHNPNPYIAKGAMKYVVPLARRFPGLELDYPLHHYDRLSEGIKGVNWLTAVHDTLLTHIGGKDTVSKRAETEGLSCREYDEGLIIQAGDTPQFGDFERDDIPEYYVKAHNLLKAVQADYKGKILVGDIPEIDKEVFSKAWFKRFEGGRP